MLKYHIQTIEVGSTATSAISFSGISQTYDDLLIVASLRTNTGDTAWNDAFVRFNGLSSNLSCRVLYGTGSTAASFSESTIRIFANGGGSTGSTFSNVKIAIPGYKSNTNKSVSCDSVSEGNQTQHVQAITAGLWADSSSINSIQIVAGAGSFVQHSSASLYGIKRGSDGKTETASGGIITQSGGYTIHTFNTSGTFVANRDLDAEYLVVAGGGGGGANVAGGGGAGGYQAASNFSLSASTSHPVIVGAGGAGSISNANPGSNGNNSLFASITSTGGGGGGRGDGQGVSGGSGGGGGAGSFNTNQSGGAGTANQGFAGGTGANNCASPNNYPAGGGGGAGAVGQSRTNADSLGGAGGAGVASSITGSSVTRAGGGGGAGNGGGGAGAAGGGNGGLNYSGAGGNATANTGSGGGGGGSANGGAGGSGVVIIRYLTPA